MRIKRANRKSQVERKAKSRMGAREGRDSEGDTMPACYSGTGSKPFQLQKDSEEYKEMCNFEQIMENVGHSRCEICRCVCLGRKVTKQRIDKVERCNTCIARKSLRQRNGQGEGVSDHLPIWVDEHGKHQYHVPEELSKLTEGEKLLIQQAAPYVPMVHLKHGMYGSQGHVSSFPQQISEVCKVLPRKKVDAIKVIKNFKRKNG